MAANNKQTAEVMQQQWFSLHTETSFLGSGWKTYSLPGLLCAVLFSAVLSIVYESINYVYHILNLNTVVWKRKTTRVLAHVLLSCVRTLSTFSAYVMMLCVMTFNVWIFISVMLGSGAGYFLSRPYLLWSIQRQVEKYRGEDNITDDISNITGVTCDGIELRKHVRSPEEEDRILRETRFSEILLDDNM